MNLPPAFSKNHKLINVIIETPAGSRNKYVFDDELLVFRLKKILPSGFSFPYDFGFIPHTRGGDGDPLDVLVLCESPVVHGCVIECRIIGMLEIVQRKKKEKAIRNDRFIAIPAVSKNYSMFKDIYDLENNLLREIMHFFESYLDIEDKKIVSLKVRAKAAAMKFIEKNVKELERM